MKSIEDILRLINNIVGRLSEENEVNIALIGGYGAIAHGVERTTSDVDFCVYADTLQSIYWLISTPTHPSPLLTHNFPRESFPKHHADGGLL